MTDIKIIISEIEWPLIIDWLETHIELGNVDNKVSSNRQLITIDGITDKWHLSNFYRSHGNIIAHYFIRDELQALHFKLRFG